MNAFVDIVIDIADDSDATEQDIALSRSEAGQAMGREWLRMKQVESRKKISSETQSSLWEEDGLEEDDKDSQDSSASSPLPSSSLKRKAPAAFLSSLVSSSPTDHKLQAKRSKLATETDQASPVVKFYGWTTQREKQLFYLSNFYYAPFKDSTGLEWGTAEAYFQSRKFTSPVPDPVHAANRLEFAEKLRTELRDAPGLILRLAGRKARGGGIGFQIAYLGIEQPRAVAERLYVRDDADKASKKARLKVLVQTAIDISKKYRGKRATHPVGDLPPQWATPEMGEVPLAVGGRLHAMVEAVVFKFWSPANRTLAAKLLSTESAALVETNPRDYFWAAGADGTGHNMLGRILGHTRTVLRNHAANDGDGDVVTASRLLAARDAVLALFQQDLATPRSPLPPKPLPSLVVSLARYKAKKSKAKSPTYSWLFVPLIAAATGQTIYSGVRVARLKTLINTEVVALIQLDNPQEEKKDKDDTENSSPPLWDRLLSAVRTRRHQEPSTLKWTASGHLSGKIQLRVLSEALLDTEDFKHLLFWAVVRHADLKI
jgi:predicted NAD-dependent protein-ADP-ribosyltransferase YbiA (DUF1768 family)